jgi:sulfate adenylyltransferase
MSNVENPNPTTPSLVTPHGGVLVDRFVPDFEVERFLWSALALPRIVLGARELADLELIATGAASPLIGFLTSHDYEPVLTSSRLASGIVWPIPLTLAIPDDTRAAIAGSREAALVDERGRVWGTLEIGEVFERDNAREARLVFGTEDVAHPGVRDLLSRPSWLAGGSVRVLPLPEALPFARHRLSPRALREEIARKGWRTVAGFQTRNPIHRAHEHLTKLALELVDGLVLHPLVGETKADDVPADVRFRVYETLLARFYPKERTLLAAFPAAMRYAGPREALFHALVRKNYGITHLIVGRDHAGVGSFYPPLAAQEFYGAPVAARREAKSPPRSPGFIVWLTGLSGAGKSTLASALKEELEEELPVSVLDGDEVRTSLSRDLGFSREDRETNVERLGFVARVLARTGAAAVVAAISPYRESRDRVRRLAEAEAIPFLEVYVHAPLDVLAERDPKGLYKRALAGEIEHFTGVSDPYEPPETPEVVVSSASDSVGTSLARLLGALEANGLLARREERVA